MVQVPPSCAGVVGLVPFIADELGVGRQCRTYFGCRRAEIWTAAVCPALPTMVLIILCSAWNASLSFSLGTLHRSSPLTFQNFLYQKFHSRAHSQPRSQGVIGHNTRVLSRVWKRRSLTGCLAAGPCNFFENVPKLVSHVKQESVSGNPSSGVMAVRVATAPRGVFNCLCPPAVNTILPKRSHTIGLSCRSHFT